MRFLVFQHIAIEHPGIFRDLMTQKGIAWDAVELDEGEPIPGLDGIKMAWLTLEGVFRRNINLKMQEAVNAVGVLLLLLLMAGLTVRDGIRLLD